MIMTRESDYAVRILRALAGGEKMTVGRICEAELVPVQFAYKILKKLAKCGYVEGRICEAELVPVQFAYKILKKLAKCGYVEIFRGAEGGCRLSADLGALTLYDLLRCIDEDLFVNACMSPDYECAWRGAHCGECRFHSNLAGLQRVIEDELKRLTVGAMLG